MALLARKLPSRLASVLICCIILLTFLVFNQEPWQKIIIKRGIEQNIQILGVHEEYNNQSLGKSTSREDSIMNKEGMSSHEVFSVSVDHGESIFPGQKSKLTEYHPATVLDQPDDFARDNPDKFWKMGYEERSEVCTV